MDGHRLVLEKHVGYDAARFHDLFLLQDAGDVFSGGGEGVQVVARANHQGVSVHAEIGDVVNS